MCKNYGVVSPWGIFAARQKSRINVLTALPKSDISPCNMHPTVPFGMFVPHDQDIGELYSVHERRWTDFEAPKLWKCWSGNRSYSTFILHSLPMFQNKIEPDYIQTILNTRTYIDCSTSIRALSIRLDNMLLV